MQSSLQLLKPALRYVISFLPLSFRKRLIVALEDPKLCLIEISLGCLWDIHVVKHAIVSNNDKLMIFDIETDCLEFFLHFNLRRRPL